MCGTGAFTRLLCNMEDQRLDASLGDILGLSLSDERNGKGVGLGRHLRSLS